MKKIINHLKENWIRHGFETLVVTVGILGAFTLNNWNDRLNLKNEIKDSLIKLQSDLKNDSILFEGQVSDLTRLLNNASSIQELLIRKNSFEDIAELRKYNIPPRNLDYFSDTYESMISTGIFSKIKNPELQNTIIEYYRKLRDNEEIFFRFNRELSAFKVQEALIPFNFLLRTDQPFPRDDENALVWMDDISSLTYQQSLNYLVTYIDYYGFQRNRLIEMKQVNSELNEIIKNTLNM
jgi:hypothetical protein